MKFSYGRIFLLGFGFFGVSILNALYNSYVPIFLQDKFDLPARIIGIFMALDNIAALFIQPTVGPWSDSVRTKVGRRMPFILIGVPVSAVAFGLIPIAAILPFFVACTTSFFLAMAFWRTPVVALMPDITPSEKRSQANGIINFMGGVGGIIAFLAGSAMYKINPGLPFWVGSGLVIMAALMVFLFVKEPKEFVQTERYNIISSLVQVSKDKDKSTFRLLFAIFFWFLGYTAIEAFFTLYATEPPRAPRSGWQPTAGSYVASICVVRHPIRFHRRKVRQARHDLGRHHPAGRHDLRHLVDSSHHTDQCTDHTPCAG